MPTPREKQPPSPAPSPELQPPPLHPLSRRIAYNLIYLASPASPERISQWIGDLKLIERYECLSPEFSSGEGPARRYEAARNGWGSGHSPNTAVWVTRPLPSDHRWSW